jgi:hypothetical protein
MKRFYTQNKSLMVSLIREIGIQRHYLSKKKAAANSTFAIGGVSCFADSFVVDESSKFRDLTKQYQHT